MRVMLRGKSSAHVVGKAAGPSGRAHQAQMLRIGRLTAPQPSKRERTLEVENSSSMVCHLGFEFG
jgi:hypothetical protein